MKGLLIEDDSFFADLLKEFLEDFGLDIKIVSSAENALKENINEYCVIIIDVMVPNDPELSGISIEESRGGYQSGVALARRFKKIKEDIPLILISAGIGGEALQWAKEKDIPFIFKYTLKDDIITALRKFSILGEPLLPKAFIVHGHDETALLELKDYLQNTLNWPEPLVLREQPSCGKTIIEKIEKYSKLIDWVFVILTPDDKVIDYTSDDDRRRGRQNVIFELGFFYGMIGRNTGKIIVLKKGKIEFPSDIHGIIWIDITDGVKKSGEEIRKEIEQ